MEEDANLGLFTFMGLASCVTFSLVLLDVDFFKLVFPHDNVEFDFAAIFKVASLIAACLTVVWGQHISVERRVVTAFALQGLSSWLLALVATFPMMMLVVTIMGASQAVAMTSLMGWGATLPRPSDRVAQMVVGMGLSGIVTGALKITIKSEHLLPRVQASKMGAFVMGFYLLAIGAFTAVRRADMKQLLSPPISHTKALSAQWLSGVGEAWKPLFLIGMSYSISMVIFPGFTAELQPSLPWYGWFHVVLYLAFLCCSVFGRLFVLPTIQATAILGFARLFYLPLFVLISRIDGTASWIDFLAVIAIATLGFTEGLVIISAAKLAPSMCSPQGREATGMLISLVGLLGTAAGLCTALALKPTHAKMLLMGFDTQTLSKIFTD